MPIWLSWLQILRRYRERGKEQLHKPSALVCASSSTYATQARVYVDRYPKETRNRNVLIGTGRHRDRGPWFALHRLESLLTFAGPQGHSLPSSPQGFIFRMYTVQVPVRYSIISIKHLKWICNPIRIESPMHIDLILNSFNHWEYTANAEIDATTPHAWHSTISPSTWGRYSYPSLLLSSFTGVLVAQANLNFM